MRGLKLIRNLGPYTLFAFCGVCALLVFTPGCPPTDPCAGNPCDDDLFCNGLETCAPDADGDGTVECSAGEPVVCPEGEICTEEAQGCIDPCETITCDDDDLCTTDECVIQTNPDTGVKFAGCVFTPVECITGAFCNPDTGECVQCLENADCQDGLYCNGAEQCLNFLCVAGVGPCAADTFCNEAAQTCDPIVCTVDADCDDAVFCNGAEACVENECIAGTDPCPAATPFCIEATQECVECVENADCPEGQSCVAGACVAAPACTADADCDDEDLCTTDTCDLVVGICVFTPLDCDDGEYCNGVETCDPATGECVAGADPCGPDEICREDTDSCEPIATLILTEGIDQLIGTNGPDTFLGSDDTYTTGDFLSGRGGIDRFNLTTTDVENDLVDIELLENYFIRNTFNGQVIDGSGWTGYEQLWYDRGTEDLTLENINELATLGVTGGSGGASDYDVEFDDAVVDTADDTLNVVLSSADAGDLTAQNAGDDEGFESIAVDLLGSNELDALISEDLDLVSFTGDGSVEIADALAGATEIDAMLNTGGVDVLADDEDMTITGGDGNDTFRFGLGEFNDEDFVDCGLGDEDVLAIRLDDDLNQNLSILACEILSIQGDDAGGDFGLELEDILDIQTIRVESLATAGTLSLDHITLNTTLMFRGDGDEANQDFDSIVLDVANAVTSLDIVFNNRGEDLDSDFDMFVDTIDVDTIETVTVNNNDGGDTTIDTLDGGDITDLTVVSETDFIITNALESEEVDEVDGSDVEGTFQVSIANSTQNATMIGGTGPNVLTGGEGEDTISGNDDEDILDGGDGDDDLIEGLGDKDVLLGGAGDDTIEGGDEDDTITGGAGADDLNGGDGDDEFRYDDQNDGAGVAVAGSFAGNDADQIEDFEPDDDVLSFANAFLDNDLASSLASGATDLNTHGFVFINNATAASLTNEANVIAAIGAVANDGGADQAAFVINNTAGDAAGVYAYVDNGVADGAVVAGELYLLAITDEAVTFANLATH